MRKDVRNKHCKFNLTFLAREREIEWEKKRKEVEEERDEEERKREGEKEEGERDERALWGKCFWQV